MELIESEIGFELNGEPVQFKLYHNLPPEFGLNIDAAIHNWVVRTEEYTPESLREYILSKQPDVIVFTEEEFNAL